MFIVVAVQQIDEKLIVYSGSASTMPLYKILSMSTDIISLHM